MVIEVWRGASSKNKIQMVSTATVGADEWKHVVNFGFGSGTLEHGTDWFIRVHPDSFKALAVAMMKAAPAEAIKAFGAALQTYGAKAD